MRKKWWKEARKIGLNEETLRQIKKRIRKNKRLVLRRRTAKLLIEYRTKKA